MRQSIMVDMPSDRAASGPGEVAAPGPANGLRVPCPVLVGRATEMSLLSEALDTACAGRGSLVFLLGEAGIGKSRLVHEVSQLASTRGTRVLRGRAVPGSGASSFRPLTEALASALTHDGPRGDLEPWLPALSAIVPGVAPVDAVEATAALRGEAILRLLQSVCGASGGVLVLEDLHWADAETLAIVDHLADNLARAPVLCLATVRSDEPSEGRTLVRRVASRRGAMVVELARLNEVQVAAMVYGCTGGSDPEAVDRLRRLADGVPFLVEEMLASPGLPASFTEGVQARLSTLSDDDRRVLLTAAAFGRHFDWRLLPVAAGISEERVVDALDRGVAAQLLAVHGDEFRFRHALTAEAVFDSITPPRRRAAAAAALAALDSRAPATAAAQLEVAARLAEHAGEPRRAGEAHRALGDEALSRGALHTAVAEFERASSLADGDSRDAALERLVAALLLAGRLDEALRVGADLTTRLPGTRAAGVHLQLAGAATAAARWTLASEHLETASKLIDADQSPMLRAELAVRRAELAIDTNDTPGAEEQARRALDIGRREALPEQECAALQLLGRCARRSSLQEADTWFQQLLQTADEHRLPVWRLRALHEIGTIGLLDTSAVDTLIEAQQLAELLGAMATATVLDIEIAAGYAGVDNFAAQRRHGEQAVRRAGQLGMDLIVGYGWQHVVAAALLTGDRELADSATVALRAAAPNNRDLEGLLASCQALAALTADDLGGALELAAQGAEALRESQTAPPAHFRAIWPVLLALTHHPGAGRALDEIERSGIGVNAGARGWLLLGRAILEGSTDPDRAHELATDSDRIVSHFPLWRRLGRRIAADAASRDRWMVPADWMPEAEAWFRDHGYPAAAGACHRLRGDMPGDVPAKWTALGISRREADVLALVIEGHSNRDIADRLYLSVRTVEKHIESLLRKTSARTRTQLARVATT
jgi:DNA-binding CsgD family transcriptional regulator